MQVSQTVGQAIEPGPAPEFQDRPDQLFGVCQAIGDDFGIDPFYLRVLFVAGLLLSPPAMFAAYAALGAVVALSRWLFPSATPAAAASEPKPVADVAATQTAEKTVGESELIAA